MRLAHTNVTQQLADWRVVLMHDGTPPSGQMRVEVLVAWDAGSYSTVGIVPGEPR
jgi:hypothetical protein